MAREKKRCKRCGKLLPSKNSSGFCRVCYRYKKGVETRKKKVSLRKCVDCGKMVKPKIVMEDGEEGIKNVSYPMRCYKCRLKNNEYNKRYRKVLKEKRT